MAKSTHILYFYRNDCESCEAIKGILVDVAIRYGIEVEMKNVAEESSYRLFESYITKECDGVPFFVNTKTMNYWYEGDQKDLEKWLKNNVKSDVVAK